MADNILSLSSAFPEASEADWLKAVDKVLKGKGPESITRKTVDGLEIKPLYRESDYASQVDPRGTPGVAPFLRGATAAPDAFLPWDIRQTFTHPDAATTNSEIMRDLERGVSSIELCIDRSGEAGVQISTLEDLTTALEGIRPDIATIALSGGADGGIANAGLLALWASTHADPATAQLDFNMDPLGALAATGTLEGGLDANIDRLAGMINALGKTYPKANLIRIDACAVHEAGGSDAQELAVLIASAIETLRLLKDKTDISALIGRMSFAIALDANYGLGVAKIRTARRLWARCLDALGLDAQPMNIQGISSARMLTRYDAWTNMLRNTASAFAGAVGGVNTLTIRAFNEALGTPEELGRRIARNTQVIAMEESQLGRVADPTGGAWFTENFSENLATKAWEEFQKIEDEGGFVSSLVNENLQIRVDNTRQARAKDIAKRKVPITGVSEFPTLENIDAPVADAVTVTPRAETSSDGLAHVLDTVPASGKDLTTVKPLTAISLAAPYEALRDAALTQAKPPKIFLATLGPLAEFTARADFARNLFAAGGLAAADAPVPPKDVPELVAAFKASGALIACICGTDARYADEANAAAQALKDAGAARVWVAGKQEGDAIDNNIFMGCDVLHTLKLAHAELGLA